MGDMCHGFIKRPLTPTEEQNLADLAFLEEEMAEEDRIAKERRPSLAEIFAVDSEPVSKTKSGDTRSGKLRKSKSGPRPRSRSRSRSRRSSSIDLEDRVQKSRELF